ncbi:hypothetical protein ACFOWB_04430 [Chenggangzhangella methanolivorans]
MQLAVPGLELFVQKHGEEVFEIVLPASTGRSDEALKIDLALKTLSGLEDGTESQIAERIASYSRDLFRARLPDEAVFMDSIRLKVAESFLRRMRQFLEAAGTAEETSLAYVRGPSPLGAAYAADCRFGHTFVGSFGFSIQSSVGPNSGYFDNEVDPARPFSRRVFERVARGMGHIAKAWDVREPRLLVEHYKDGFNSNMLENFSILLATGGVKRLEIDIDFSPEWKTPPDIARTLSIGIDTAAAHMMQEAAAYLRANEPPPLLRLTGTVSRLETSDRPPTLLERDGFGEIYIEWLFRGSRRVRTRVRLPIAEYYDALRAHSEGLRVSVAGYMDINGGNMSELGSPFDFEVLDD